MTKIGIVGLGYVGLPLAIESQAQGHSVVGVDINLEKINGLRAGKSYIEGISSETLVNMQKKGLILTTEFSELKDVDSVILCVPTPLTSNLKPDFTFLRQAMSEVARYASSGTLIINESTSTPGTVRNLLPGIAAAVDDTKEFRFAVAPERIDPGNQFWNLRNTPRLLGAVEQEALNEALKFYESICDDVVVVSSPEIAELAKLLENTYRLVNISLVNEIAKLASSVGIPILEVVEAASSKPYGFQRFIPGLGVGGHCIPVDPLFLTEWAQDQGVPLTLVECSIEINEGMAEYVCSKLRPLKSLCKSRVLILGVAYKPGVADIRESPAIKLMKALSRDGWNIDWWDPHVNDLTEFSKANDSIYDCVVVSHRTNDEWAIRMINNAKYVFDFSGQFGNEFNIQSL